mmetsp:Transcript_7752/g.11631  ORF Transcript_7752/g.11631 Transcript_7752/m.11631 type:complete len:81 (-) Transcript_7752:763-1005(-)
MPVVTGNLPKSICMKIYLNSFVIYKMCLVVHVFNIEKSEFGILVGTSNASRIIISSQHFPPKIIVRVLTITRLNDSWQAT